MTNFDRKLSAAALLMVIVSVLYVVTRMSSCGLAPSGEQEITLPTCGELKLGDSKKEACPAGGEKVSVCTEKGLEVALECKDPEACGKVSFTDIKPIITASCVSCHPGFDNYSAAKPRGLEMVRRVNLTAADLQRMPKTPASPLSAKAKETFTKWQTDGFLERCPTGSEQPGTKVINFDDIEAEIEQTLNNLNQEDRENSRFLIVTHKIDHGDSPEDLDRYVQGAAKAINSVNGRKRSLVKLTMSKNGVIRLNLDDFEFDALDWKKITAADPLKIESFTNRGQAIKLLTQEKRPWMHFDNFIQVTQSAKVYYDLLGVPVTLGQLLTKLGVRFEADFLNFKAHLIGTNKSPISLQKNRLISRHDSLDGSLWFTYDPIALNGVRQRNLFEFPLLKETGGKAVFQFAAGEAIFTLPNGMQGYALFNAAGQRQDAAPLNVVNDTESPITPEIKAGISCHRCHSGGIIPAVDEIRDHVIRNASQFLLNDVEIVKALYKTADRNTAVISQDSDRFKTALTQLGATSPVDPLNFSTDQLLLGWDLRKTAAFFFMAPEEFVTLLNQSATARSQVGQLLSGGTVTFDQVIAVIQILIQDLRLFQEPIEG